MNKKIMVFTWLDDNGMKPTGRLVQRNGVLVPEFSPCKKSFAAVWSSDSERFAEGRQYAAKEGYRVHLLPDTKDVLVVARRATIDQS